MKRQRKTRVKDSKPIQPMVKALMGIDPRTPDSKARDIWNRMTSHVCKPCWELKYCPYGPLVEQFPLSRITREEAAAHNKFLKEQLAKGAYDADPQKRTEFEREARRFRPSKYPDSLPEEEETMACNVFGHLCPVFFVNEPLAETSERRNISRMISFKTKIRVARRDNYTCQECGKHLKDSELEFDHIVPFSKGGTSDEHNLRLACADCNRRKGARHL